MLLGRNSELAAIRMRAIRFELGLLLGGSHQRNPEEPHHYHGASWLGVRPMPDALLDGSIDSDVDSDVDPAVPLLGSPRP